MSRRPRIVLGTLLLLFAPLRGLPAEPTAGPRHATCATCHDARVERLPGETCKGCHGDVDGVRPGSRARFSHEGLTLRGPDPAPDGTIGCATCHAPHDNGGAFQLADVRSATQGIDAASRLCISCHPHAADFRLAGGTFGRHPVGVGVDTVRLARATAVGLAVLEGSTGPVVSCLTCHRVHANDNRFLLRWDADGEIAACTACHRNGMSLPNNLRAHGRGATTRSPT